MPMTLKRVLWLLKSPLMPLIWLRGVPGARDIDNKMSDARRRVCWDEMFQYAIEPEKPQRYYNELPPEEKTYLLNVR